jgi:hypothetical protein
MHAHNIDGRLADRLQVVEPGIHQVAQGRFKSIRPSLSSRKYVGVMRQHMRELRQVIQVFGGTRSTYTRMTMVPEHVQPIEKADI